MQTENNVGKRSRISMAISILVVGMFLSLLFCVYMVNGGLFWSFVPLWMLLAGMVVYILLGFSKKLTNNRKVHALAFIVLAVIAGIVLVIL